MASNSPCVFFAGAKLFGQTAKTAGVLLIYCRFAKKLTAILAKVGAVFGHCITPHTAGRKENF